MEDLRIIERDIVGALIESADGKFLFGKSRKGGVYPGCYLIPGGGIDAGETGIDAVHREVLEETGIDTKAYEAKLISDNRTGQSEKTLRDTGEMVLVNMHFFDYHIRIHDKKAGEITLSPDDDLTDLMWISKEDFEHHTFSSPTYAFFEDMGLV